MASPQAENGHTDIAHEILEKLAQMPLSGAEFRVLMVVLRRTYGWHKSEDMISLTQFQQATGFPRWTVWDAIERLIKKNILVRKTLLHSKENLTTPPSIYRFNKDWETWVSPERVVRKSLLGSKEKPTGVVRKSLPTKENNTKEKNLSLKREREAKASPPAPKKRRLTKTPFPEGSEALTLLEEMKIWANENTPSIDATLEFEKCRDNFNGRGVAMVDWKATIRNWYRRAVEFGPNGRKAQPIGQDAAMAEARARVLADVRAKQAERERMRDGKKDV